MNTYTKLPVGIDRLHEGISILERYRAGRAGIESRILADERFWNSRHESTPLSRSSDMPAPASAWMFSVIINKHADMLENLPSPVCLAREQSDAEYASTLSCVLPAVFDRLNFNSIYSDVIYDKLKHGTGVYGVFWDPCAENGLGDIDIKRIDLLNLYFEPGISELEQSSNLFYVSLADKQSLSSNYPWAFDSSRDHKSAGTFNLSFISPDDDKCVVIDWYYKKSYGTKTVLHYIKFTGDSLLYSSENDPAIVDGFYSHGHYPFVFDRLYRETDSPCGYGLISITKGTQMYIDRLDENIIERSIMASKPRYLMKKNVGLNKSEFLDWNNPIVEVEGDLTEERLKAITLPVLDSSVITVRDSKINEMREVSSNRNVNYGETSPSLTSGVAIAALQEAGNKVSRDIISGSWNAFVSVTNLVIELMREFYTDKRYFRITRPNEDMYSYIAFSGDDIREKEYVVGDISLFRKPIFDIEVRALKSSAFSRLSQNETIIQLCKLGLFNPENAAQAITVLDALELEGKNRIIENIKKSIEKSNNTSQTGYDSIDSDTAKSKLSFALHSAASETGGGL